MKLVTVTMAAYLIGQQRIHHRLHNCLSVQQTTQWLKYINSNAAIPATDRGKDYSVSLRRPDIFVKVCQWLVDEAWYSLTTRRPVTFHIYSHYASHLEHGFKQLLSTARSLFTFMNVKVQKTKWFYLMLHSFRILLRVLEVIKKVT